MKTKSIAVAIGALAILVGGYWALIPPGATKSAASQTKKETPGAQNEKDAHASERTVMSDAKLAAANIVLEPVKPAVLSDTLVLNGIIRPNQERLVQVTPRFAGVVRQVQKRIGDRVRRDELLARIESNQSLTAYELKAPIDGTVIDRQVALGEYVSEQKPAFIVADLSSVWIDFAVHLKDLARVRVGDVLEIDASDGNPEITAKISYLSPIGLADTQSALARAVVPNNESRLRPGLFVRGTVTLTGRKVPIAVKLSALQTIGAKTVVFVREGEAMEARAVKLGEQDREFAEVLDGLQPGDMYATENSFVVKAEIGKAEADHD